MTMIDSIPSPTSHTPEPWGDNDDGVLLGNLDNYAGVAPVVAVVEGYDDEANASDEARANSRRIAAAINACQGIPTEALEQGTVAEMLAALKQAHSLILDMGKIIRGLDDNHEWLEFWTQDGDYLCSDSRFDAIDAAITKAKGNAQ